MADEAEIASVISLIQGMYVNNVSVTIWVFGFLFFIFNFASPSPTASTYFSKQQPSNISLSSSSRVRLPTRLTSWGSADPSVSSELRFPVDFRLLVDFRSRGSSIRALSHLTPHSAAWR